MLVLTENGRFNPTLVRLARFRVYRENTPNSCFNPTLVRLAPNGARAEKPTRRMFQSHLGSISTCRRCAAAHPRSRFNPTLVRLARD